MVHARFNDRDPNPNPHIDFITPLPGDDQHDARQLLRALAAQVRPVMKAHGFVINSFEEYEHNGVFAGRNWNNGETVELVLRRPGGSFLPTYWLMSTLCHEYMNHGSPFQALWRQLRTEVRKLQDGGYYGDGYWSAGTRLADSAKVAGEGIEPGDLPEYVCGGAQTRSRPSATRRRRSARRADVVPSNHTGRQTAKRRKAGSRIISKYAFQGEGLSLNDSKGEDRIKGNGFKKQAGSMRAREERALAAERRLQALQSLKEEDIKEEEENTDRSDSEVEIVSETDGDRREALISSEKDDLRNLKSSWEEFKDDFIFTGDGKDNVIEISSDEENVKREPCDIPVPSGSTFTSGVNDTMKRSENNGKGKEKETPPLGLGKLVKTEVDFRKKEALGMVPTQGSRRLGGRVKSKESDTEFSPTEPWECAVCTLINKPRHLACSACFTPRGNDYVYDKYRSKV
ncbi:WLM-domain-containing protein [Guyanagaster necrorhizus]|uniref:WLM-domain-containing protein n=1 Tax=Guyanagaster necrorhizus TaxID=856835 RepID=A0A9P7W212_9AGAR|nr:WLM-domain-containing protein [Guyanagaster necrorhizus MCA 3950]KAG7451134.1 WLM-domain-containing protein [Guyanagaster necrorhizus MCA 3950]